ncbi:hypothetical protein REC12_16615 [Desulfosporosinus sp. PR]|uniref:hypothetical protein n=1 Tax=Candidatus Desulfosporosinus nitrosoreducens TaxID=3401928 RepID=UPI0027F484C9|nr:hypothetical protein [Desulfosporosinus sp. PR]MDQ7095217.1 hypothetical protein [Desulfosporosinus sp. PR]
MKLSLYILILVFVFGLLSFAVVPPLLKKKQRKELIVVISLFSIGFTLNFLLIIGVKLPNPLKILIEIIQSVL